MKTQSVTKLDCPACSGGIVEASVYRCARGYLCTRHRAVRDAADDREHARSNRCPHTPRICVRGLCNGGAR
jgi:hypothetical protein